MAQGDPPAPRRGVWRADIARLVVRSRAAAGDAGHSFLLGWERVEAEVAPQVPVIVVAPPIERAETVEVVATADVDREQWPHIPFWAASKIVDAPEERPPLYLGEPLTLDELRLGDEALRSRPLPEPLVPWASLDVALHELISDRSTSRSPDTGLVVERLARGEVLQQVPRRKRHTWPARLWIVVDRSERLLGLLDDARGVVTALRRACGPGAVFEPKHALLEQVIDRRAQAEHGFDDLLAEVPNDATLLFVSDLGIYGSVATRRAWARTWRALRRRVRRLATLLPAPQRRWPGWLRQGEALVWGGDRGGFEDAADVADDAALLAELLALSPVCERALLRKGRLAVSQSRGGVEVEVAAALQLCSRSESSDEVRDIAIQARTATEGRNAQVAAFARVVRHLHEDLPPELRALEALRWSEALPSHEGPWTGAEAAVALDRLTATILQRHGDGAVADAATRFGFGLEGLASTAGYANTAFGEALQRVVAAAFASRPDVALPLGVSAEAAAGVAGEDARRRWRLVQGRGELRVMPADGEVAAGGVELGLVVGDALQVVAGEGKDSKRIPLDSVTGALVALPEANELKLRIGRSEVRIRRPDHEPWLSGMWRDRIGLHATLTLGPADSSAALRWRTAGTDVLESHTSYRTGSRRIRLRIVDLWYCDIAFPKWASWCDDDEFGLFAVWKYGGVQYRFRWIPPGRFLMGSPGDDDEAFDDEKPQHEVALTRGFWLGETPVTQKLWYAVTGNNLSHDKAGLHPVTDVSWDECNAFCDQANDEVDGLALRLPSEAEWEYACRAGTDTARYGDPGEIAWFDLNSGYSTHEVMRKKPNAFGLYDTLGNVWEWCGDWYGAYESDAAVDPAGPEAGRLRVLRGGSWDLPARSARAAYRGAYPPDNRWYGTGFRLARGHQVQAPDQAIGPRSQQPAQGPRSGPASGGGVRGPSAAAKPPRAQRSPRRVQPGTANKDDE